MSKQKVIVGMSGGVDSSVAAWLLKEQGYEVEGVFMKNWEEDDTDDFCSAAEDVKDAKAVCDKLDIPLHTINFSAEYWDNVFEHFLAEYKAGRTPNPDILCNKEIKFKAFLAYAKTLHADYIATGHYVRRRDIADRTQMVTAVDMNKDQSYFLYTLGQDQLVQSLFPIGDYPKPEIREMAKNLGLVTHNKKDSTGICFIGERKFKDFLQRFLPAQPGEIVTETGDIIGRHEGLMYYTMGQRQGLGIGGVKNAPEEPWYVAAKDLEKNQLMVVQGYEHPALYLSELTANQLYWTHPLEAPQAGKAYHAKVRYRQTAEPCKVLAISDEEMVLSFDAPVRAITPGQSVVLYQDDVCMGGGVIV